MTLKNRGLRRNRISTKCSWQGQLPASVSCWTVGHINNGHPPSFQNRPRGVPVQQFVRPFVQTPAWHQVGTSAGSGVAGTPEAASSTRSVQVRIAKQLMQRVWPKPTNDELQSTLPEHQQISESHAALVKRRVIYSLSLMLGGKLVTIQVPFLFRNLVDSLPAHVDGTTTALLLAEPTTVVPLTLVLGYGISRATASGMQEMRNAVFAHVAQDAIRRFGTSVFDHVHQLDMTYHLSRNTGTLSRVLDRGNRSISYVLNALVFNVVPTTIEVSVVTGLMAYEFGAMHSCVVLGTIASYTAFTVGVTTWRTQ